MRQKLQQAGLSHVIVDSAGTYGGHAGEAPDSRTQAMAKKHGYDLSSIRSRKITGDDFDRFDALYMMDEDNLENVRNLCPPEHHHKLHLLVEDGEVPDPYYGAESDFQHVLTLCEQAAERIIREIFTNGRHSHRA